MYQGKRKLWTERMIRLMEARSRLRVRVKARPFPLVVSTQVIDNAISDTSTPGMTALTSAVADDTTLVNELATEVTRGISRME